MEFHVSRQVRDKYKFDQTLFALDGNVLFADLYAVRQFVSRVNQQSDLLHFPERALKSGQVNALGLIDEIFHYVIYIYRQQVDKKALSGALEFLQNEMGEQKVAEVLALFLNEFPPVAVYNKKQTNEEYLAGKTKGTPNWQLVLEEFIIYSVTIHNPALGQCAEFFDSSTLDQNAGFHQAFTILQAHFDEVPGFGPHGQPLIELLMSPAKHVPHSLTGQLEYIRENWASFLGEYFYRILTSLDLIKEEEKKPFGGPGPVPIPVYDHASFLAAGGTSVDKVAFSADRDWMPGLVLIAKNSYVWLDQLSKKYQRLISRLDQIPDEELIFLAQAGVTGLWLIGLWERSQASARIKRLCGNPEAIASAYSLASYTIAADLGGENAYQSLRDKAWSFGIRLASDMVPNHMGIDSDWVIHHPEWFLSLDHCPYPSYSFNGPDLSRDPSVTIQIEDHYYDQSDAAVVFRRIDNATGRARFIYHGNDGTSMPWNDTAQLNYLQADVREMVYQTILSVARKFPIIRFDAAMTLAKKQIRRLWFPEPGQGGAIPSRSEHPLTNDQFEAAMPEEFWRNVVDRIALEAPDTLLLAEAFWMMEGYFVRTLGMHRVYNSAFMHMLRDENNSGYKQLLKNTLEFEPEILKRYVNFMNNPDEKTALEQFGKGDKYFGVCTLMATFPGLPMLGHGQIEGFAEKYGMEYRRAYLDEISDPYLVERHQREIFPLLKKRAQFSGMENFWLFDFSIPGGQVNDNVYAFTNGIGNDRYLVMFNNNYESTDGGIKTSSPRVTSSGSYKRPARIELAASLGLGHSKNDFIVFRDHSTNLQFIRPLKQVLVEGFHVHLNGYESHVFYDFHIFISDQDHNYQQLCEFLGERGVPDIEKSLQELFFQPILQPLRDIVNPGYFRFLAEITFPVKQPVLLEAGKKFNALLLGIEKTFGKSANKDRLENELPLFVKAILELSQAGKSSVYSLLKKPGQALNFIEKGLTPANLYTLITWAFIGRIGELFGNDSDGSLSQAKAEEWQLYKIYSTVLLEMGFPETEVATSIQALKLITSHQNWYAGESGKPTAEIIEHLLSIPDVQEFLQLNRFEGVLWYNREAYSSMLWWLMVIARVKQQGTPESTQNQAVETLIGSYEIIKSMKKADLHSDFQVEKLLEYSKKS